jgi:hypothetical protein
MISQLEWYIINRCVEGFLFGNISVLRLRALNCTLAEEVRLFLDLGIYSGIFAIYLQCPSKESRTAIILFYVFCLLYVLSMADVACDLLQIILAVSINSICNIIIYADAYYRCTTIASVSKWLTVNEIPRLFCPIRSKRFL